MRCLYKLGYYPVLEMADIYEIHFFKLDSIWVLKK